MRSSPERKEYSRLRSIARKRLERARDAGLMTTLQYNRQALKLIQPTKELTDPQIRKATQDLQEFLAGKTTVKAIRQAQRETAKSNRKRAKSLSRNYNIPISDKDLPAFGKYMDWLKKQAIDNIFDSGAAVDMFANLKAAAMSIPNVDVNSILQNFKYWLTNDNLRDLENAAQIPEEFWRKSKATGRSSQQIRNAIKRYANR